MYNSQQNKDTEILRNSLESHSTDVDFPSFSENYTPTISIQPQLGVSRRAVPIFTTWQTPGASFLPTSGLDFLLDIEQLHIQQTIELNTLLANDEESENRYTVKVPQGDTVYYASEKSSSFQRMCFGPSRSFTMKMYDPTEQEALELRRRLACGSCSFWCYLQAMEVYLPSGEQIGTIEQRINLNVPTFLVYNNQRNPIHRIEGPTMCACLSFGKDAHFKIYTADGQTQVGSINRQWDQIQRAYNLCLRLPGRAIDIKCKALLLGAAFLVEYMYFSKSPGCKCSC